MANIVLTNRCNLNCSYCFAHDLLSEKYTDIDIQQLSKILTYFDNTYADEEIGLIGGEPTLHPKFNDIFNVINLYSIKTDRKIKLFTNGLLLGKYINTLCSSDNIIILVNANSANDIGQFNYQMLINSLDAVSKTKLINKTTLGINLYPNIINYKYIVDLCVRYNLPVFRCSVTAPVNKVNKDKFYTQSKSAFLQLVEYARSYGIKINLDCNKIPICYYDENELRVVRSVVINNDIYHCDPVIDIKPDLTATSCFGTYYPINIEQFSNFNEIRDFFINNVLTEKIKFNGIGKCATCHKYYKECQGGCLAFASNVN